MTNQLKGDNVNNIKDGNLLYEDLVDYYKQKYSESIMNESPIKLNNATTDDAIKSFFEYLHLKLFPLKLINQKVYFFENCPVK